MWFAGARVGAGADMLGEVRVRGAAKLERTWILG